MKDTKSTQSDLEILTQLNADYLASDQNGRCATLRANTG